MEERFVSEKAEFIDAVASEVECAEKTPAEELTAFNATVERLRGSPTSSQSPVGSFVKALYSSSISGPSVLPHGTDGKRN